jgi:alpha-galactosidase
MGIEWDLATMTDAELEELKRWVALHKEMRGCCTAAPLSMPTIQTRISGSAE